MPYLGGVAGVLEGLGHERLALRHGGLDEVLAGVGRDRHGCSFVFVEMRVLRGCRRGGTEVPQ